MSEPADHLAKLQRQYAAALRTTEEHGLPMTRHVTACCNKEVWLSKPAPHVIDCPHCGCPGQIAEATK